jgi:hypothetical protein
MSCDKVQFNPYEAPEAPTSEAGLAPDTEFLINHNVIAGIGKIDLPKICVLSGENQGLVRRSSQLRWCSQQIVVPRNIMCAISLIVVVSAVVSSSRTVPGAPGVMVFSLTQLAFTFGIVAVAAGLILLSILFRKNVEVSWYISERLVRRQKIRLGIILFLTIAAIVLISLFGIGRDSGMILIPCTIAFMLVLRGFRGSQPLRVVGQHNGLLLVSGFSRAFASEALKLVSAWERRQFEGALKTVIPAPE